MSRPVTILAALAVVAVAALVPTPVAAAGPVDSSLTIFYWDSEFEMEGGTGLVEDSAGNWGLDGSLWIHEKFGIAAAFYRTDLDDLPGATDDTDDVSLDFKYKLFSPTDKNFIAIGVGWQEAGLTITSALGDTSGPRLVGEAGVGFKQVNAYGRIAYMPFMDDIDPSVGPTLEDVEAVEFEVGVQWRVAPFLHFRLAWHSIEFDMEAQGSGAEVTTTSDGLVLGVGVHF